MASGMAIVFENTEKVLVQQPQLEHLDWLQQGILGVGAGERQPHSVRSKLCDPDLDILRGQHFPLPFF